MNIELTPIIDINHLWRQEKQNQDYFAGQKIIGEGRGLVSLSYNKTKSKLGSWEREDKRGTLKFRCSAAAHKLNCIGRKKRHKDTGRKNSEYGLSIRVSLEKKPRIFTPTPHGSVTWERGYKLRNSIEQITSKADKMRSLVSGRHPQVGKVFLSNTDNLTRGI